MAVRIERAKLLFKQLQNELMQQLIKDVTHFNARVSKAVEAAHEVHRLSELSMALDHMEAAVKAQKEIGGCMKIAKQLNTQEVPRSPSASHMLHAPCPIWHASSP
eukprot:4294455-Prymnesium_polylepis.1